MKTMSWSVYFGLWIVTQYKGNAVNVAVNKSAIQSSTINHQLSSGAGNVVDGNSNPYWNQGSCIHTDNLQGNVEQWWMVDLFYEYYITQVSIQRRVDSPGSLENFVVETFLSNPSLHPGTNAKQCKYYSAPFPDTETAFSCIIPQVGRFLRIRKLTPFVGQSLMICEVKVEGLIVGGCNQRKLTRVAGQRVNATSDATYENTLKADCTKICTNEATCQAFNFNVVYNTCVVIIVAWESDVIFDDVSWDLYYM